MDKDWRLQGQEKYLFGKKLIHKNYFDRTNQSDHDHCEFCNEKFSDSDIGCLLAGFATIDNYHWICEKCFDDFKSEFEWAIE